MRYNQLLNAIVGVGLLVLAGVQLGTENYVWAAMDVILGIVNLSSV